MNEKSSSANRQIARAAGTVMLAFVLSNLVGLLRQILVSRTFGTNESLDAFYAAATFPDLLFNLLAGGALSSAFIPTFTGFMTKNDRKDAWRLASAITNLVILALSLVSLSAALFAPAIVRHVIFIFRPGLEESLQTLTIDLLRIILIAPTIFGVSGLVMGILNTHQKFWMPALAPVFNWIGWILGLFLFVPVMGIRGLAWGYVLGAALHLCVQIPDLLRLEVIDEIVPEPPGGAHSCHEALFRSLDATLERQLAELAPRCLLGLADSAYNKGELVDLGYHPTAVAPLLGLKRAGPASGFQARSARLPARPSYSSRLNVTTDSNDTPSSRWSRMSSS